MSAPDLAPPADLSALVDTVEDEAGFRKFVQALALDHARDRELIEELPPRIWDSGPLGWAHSRIDEYLIGVASVRRITDENPWRRCARMLLGGKYYE